MSIMAKAPSGYKKIGSAYLGERPVDKVFNANGDVVYALQRELTGVPPLLFKGKEQSELLNYRICGNTETKQRDYSGSSPLTVPVHDGELYNYRIYGNTVNGESVGEFVTEGEHAGEYAIPIQVENSTATIYLPEPIKMVGDEAEYVDFYSQKQYFADGTSTAITVPALPISTGTNTVTVNTTVQPSNVEVSIDENVSVGDLVTSGEHAGEYNVPVTVAGKNLFDVSTITPDCYVDNEGRIIGNDGIDTSDFIKVFPNTNYTYKGVVIYNVNTIRIAYYDQSKNFISRHFIIGNAADGETVTTPSNCEYVKLSYDKVITNLMLNAGSTPLPYEPYHAPVTTPIYLTEPIKMVGDEAEYIDYAEQKMHRVRVNLSEVNEFSNSITDTADKLRIWVQQGKNDSFVYPAQSGIFVITEPTTITTNITITNDNDSIRIKHNGYTRDIVIDIVRGLSPGAYSVSFNVLNYDYTTVGGVVINNIMVNKGSTALPYEPYIENTDLDVTLPALPTIRGTNQMSIDTEVQPSRMDIKGRIKSLT